MTTFADIFFKNMKLIAVTTPHFFVEEDKIITELFEEGLDILHLRKPDTAAVYSERLLKLIPEKYHKKIVTHEHFYTKEEFNLMGIHLNSRNSIEPESYEGHISCSCHSIEEVKQKKELYDYVFMSPIFDSVSKVGYQSKYTPEDLRSAAKDGIIDKNVIALGGIAADNILEVKDFGFGGAALLGDLWGKFDCRNDQDYLGIIRHFKKLKEIAD
jgi:thiamine-phosphate pyrophosphorylase